MELDDMKQAWQQLNQRLDRQQALNLRLYREGRLDKLRHGLRPLIWGQAIQLAFGVLFMLLGTAYWTSHMDAVHRIVLGALVLNETIDSRLLIGTLLVIGGIALVNMHGRLPFRREPRAEEPVASRSQAAEPRHGDLG